MKLAVFSKIGNQLPPEDLCATLAQHGYHGVEWQVHPDGHILPEELDAGARRVAEAARSNGLESLCLAGYLRLGDDGAVTAIGKQLGAAAAIGCPNVRIWAPAYQGTIPYETLFTQARADLKRVTHQAAVCGVRALVEVHFGTIVPSVSLTLRLLEGLDPKHVGVIYDPDNLTQEGLENWQLGLELLEPYLAYVQFKNAVWSPAEKVAGDGWQRWRREYVPLDQGLVDWPAFVKLLRQMQYDGYLSNEDTRPLPLAERLTTGRDTILRLWNTAPNGDSPNSERQTRT